MSVPAFCKYGVKKPGYHCLGHDCPFAGHAPAPNEIAYSHENGEVGHDSWIGFGGDMAPEPYHEQLVTELKDTWQQVCKEKVEEAYEAYMALSHVKEKLTPS
ncbi:hypothetical protein [Paenibacillus methanolicus]|uniref:Uncharacterized protein n=1 Tax=Paenibacillus methanolicus TaxID=582686 RepID=A0A5S5C4H4_9BACL|nr:hypothetical protein [Paenibacillus methanolicus]TYP73230.1 hypothetical protein BCM02_107214 [Paenibacillus methanolicus]